eukprot:m.11842 g.11842  ORF g.11842 m.11842 type:complete len:352 (-) comp5881_c0_seq1:24-1079(-)
MLRGSALRAMFAAPGRVVRPVMQPTRALHTTTPTRNPFVVRFGLFLIGRGVQYVREKLPQRAQWLLSPWTLGTGAGLLLLNAVHNTIDENPITGRRQICMIPDEQMLEISNQAEEEYLAQFSHDIAPSNQREVRMAKRILERLGHNMATRHMHFRLYYINQRATNAFVLPNGAVFLFHGLVEMLEANEDALACVLSHEICHVVARHGQEKITFATIWNYVEAVAWVLGGLIGIPFVVPMIGGSVSDFCEEVVFAPHSRDNEREADKLGMYMASEACYNPRAAPQVWRRFQEKGIPHSDFASTHPSHAEREANLQAELENVLLCSAPQHCGGSAWPSIGELFHAIRRSLPGA